MIDALGDYAFWPGLYAIGCLWLLNWLNGSAVRLDASVFVLLTAQGGYLLDRVKLSLGRIDPADHAAQPRRFAVLAARQGRVRAAAIAELAAAAALGLRIDPWLAAVPPAAAVGVWIYAGRPAGLGPDRPKDWPLIKAGLIAGAHAGLSLAVMFAGRAAARAFDARLVIASAALAALVFADAVLCDLDDLAADRHFGTRTVPAQFGPTIGWTAAAIATVAAAAGVFLVRPPTQAGLFAALALAGLGVAAALPRRRDFVDARLIVIAAACVLAA